MEKNGRIGHIPARSRPSKQKSMIWTAMAYSDQEQTKWKSIVWIKKSEYLDRNGQKWLNMAYSGKKQTKQRKPQIRQKWTKVAKYGILLTTGRPSKQKHCLEKWMYTSCFGYHNYKIRLLLLVISCEFCILSNIWHIEIRLQPCTC